MTSAPRWAAAVLAVGGICCLAAPSLAQKSAGRKPPARIERQLAGVKLGSRITTLLKSPTYSNPDQIVVGGSAAAAGADSALAGGGFGGGVPGSPFPGGGSPFPGQPSPFMSPGGPSPYPGGPPTMPGMGTGLPALGGPFPGGGGAPGDTGMEQAGGVAMTYVYGNFRGIKGFRLEIQADEDGRVVQLVGTSKNPCGVYTSRGIGFGSSYARVIEAYNWPESQTQVGEFLQVSYQETAHVAFQLLSKKIVRIVVAEVG